MPRRVFLGSACGHQGEAAVSGHIVLVLGKQLYDKSEEVALCQEDAEAVVSTLSVE